MKTKNKKTTSVLIDVILFIISVPLFDFILDYSFKLMNKPSTISFFMGFLLCGTSLIACILYLDFIIKQFLPRKKEENNTLKDSELDNNPENNTENT